MTNKPNNGYYNWILRVEKQGTVDRYVQFFYGINEKLVFFRWYMDDTSGWSSWQKISYDIPNFYKNYNSIGALADGLGGLPPFTGNGGEDISPNNLIDKSGVHFVNAGQNGNPDSTSQWIIISHIIFSTSMGGSFGVQLAFAIDNPKVYYRMIWSSVREWKEL